VNENGTFVNEEVISAVDILASNGVVHKIDGVMWPQEVLGPEEWFRKLDTKNYLSDDFEFNFDFDTIDHRPVYSNLEGINWCEINRSSRRLDWFLILDAIRENLLNIEQNEVGSVEYL